MLEAGGARGHVYTPSDFLERGQRGAPCCEEMYYEVCSPQQRTCKYEKGGKGTYNYVGVIKY